MIEIGEEAFKDSTELTSVVIPDSVVRIRKHAFAGCMGLKSVGLPSGVQLGTLAVGQTTLINGTDYTLNIADGSLSVTLKATGAAPADTEAPTVTNVAADITGPTNRNVTVTASFDDNVGVTQSLYRIGDGEWTEYTDGVTVNENTTVYFKAVDAAGNESEIASYKVENIDKAAPVKPTASADVTAPTSGDVLVSAVFSEDSAVKEIQSQRTDVVSLSEFGPVHGKWHCVFPRHGYGGQCLRSLGHPYLEHQQR